RQQSVRLQRRHSRPISRPPKRPATPPASLPATPPATPFATPFAAPLTRRASRTQIAIINGQYFSWRKSGALEYGSQVKWDPAQGHIRAIRARPTMTTCVACTVRFWTFDVFVAPCGHVYCRGCAQFLFSAATRDETAFPPRCCGAQIPLALVD